MRTETRRRAYGGIRSAVRSRCLGGARRDATASVMTGSAPRTRLEDTSARSRGRLITSLVGSVTSASAPWFQGGLARKREAVDRTPGGIRYLLGGMRYSIYRSRWSPRAREERLWVRWLDMEILYFFLGGGVVSHGTEERAFVRRVH